MRRIAAVVGDVVKMGDGTTDPAEELAETCSLLANTGGKGRSENVLADTFAVGVWSKEFYQSVFCIVDRADYVGAILRTMQLSSTFLEKAQVQIDGLKAAFTAKALAQNWDSAEGTRAILAKYTEPVRMLSPTVGQRVSYPRLSDAQAAALIEELDGLIEWLNTHSIEQGEFIKVAILEGLSQFRFRLSNLKWLGWHYVSAPLDAVAGGGLALDRVASDPTASPKAHAALLKISSFLGTLYKATGQLVDATDRVDALIRVYSLLHMVGDGVTAVKAITHIVA